MSDACIHCAATGCDTDTATHAAWCPQTTGVWPVEASLVDARCTARRETFRRGEHYTTARISETHAAIVCLGCGALGMGEA